MKFGIFYDISVPRPWDREKEKKSSTIAWSKSS